MLSKFEDRMLKLKGIKLPSKAHQVVPPIIQGRTATQLNNTMYDTLNTSIATMDDNQESDYEETHQVSDGLDDIVVGVVRSFDKASSHKGFKLNKAVVVSILDSMPIISSKAIMVNYGYSRSQAGQYLKACSLTLMFYSRHKIKSSLEYLAQYSE